MARRVGTWLLLVAAAVAAAGCKDGGDGAGFATTGIKANPDTLNFGPTAIGEPKTLELTVENLGRSPFHVNKATPSVAYVKVEDFQPFMLTGGETRKLKVTFAPEVEGELTGIIALDTDAQLPKNVHAQLSVAGRGVKALANVLTDRIDYGNVELNTAKMNQISLKNPTAVDAPVRFTFTGPDADEFTSTEADQPLTLVGGESHMIAVGFKPTRLGVAQAFARIIPCSGCDPVLVELVGSGIASQLDISPLVVDFGRVPVGASDEQTVVIRNLGAQPFDLRGAQLINNPGNVFEITRQPVDKVLLPNASVQIGVTFRPTTAGTVRGGLLALGVVPTGSTGPGPKLAITAEGGNSCVTVLPHSLDFGVVPEGFDATRNVDVYNRCPQDVTLSSVSVATTTGGYFTAGQPGTTLALPPGGSGSLAVTFTPKPGAGTSSGALSFKVFQGTSTSVEHVALTGTGRVFAACSYRIDTPAVDYGLVPVGAQVTLGVSLTNTGTDACYVAGLGLMSGSDPQFSADGWQATLINPGQQAVLPVRFQPSAEGTFNALVEAWVNNPNQGHPTIPLTGKGVLSCLTVQPTTVDFGLNKLGCAARTRAVNVINNCDSAMTLSTVGLAPGASPEYSLVSPPASMPVTLAAHAQLSLQLRYQPVDEGTDIAAFRVDAGQGPLTVGVVGSAKSQPTQTDRFMQDPQSKVDVLFVVDNSGSMSEEQQSLAQNFAAFIRSAEKDGIDYHIGVTTTGIEGAPGGWSVCPGGVDGGEAGRLFPADNTSPRIITPQTPNVEAVFAHNVQVGICHWDEKGIEAAYRALSPPLVNSADDPSTPQPSDGNAGFLRDDAKLAVVFISDEDDGSQGQVAFYETFFKSLKGNNPSLLSLSAIVGPLDLSTCPTASGSGTRYIQLAQDTGGVVESICTQDWAASLENLSHNAFGPKRSFQLSQEPADPAAITVQVNGVPVTTGWSYDPSTRSVVFTVDAAPAAGAIIDVTYPLGC